MSSFGCQSFWVRKRLLLQQVGAAVCCLIKKGSFSSSEEVRE